MGWIVGLVWLFVVQAVYGAELKNASDFPISNRNWDIQKNLCRLCAHSSVLIDDGSKIVLDGGQAKFKVQQSDHPEYYWEVPDLHGALAILDLTNDFKLSDTGFIKIIRRHEGGDGDGGYIPVANRAHMWQDNLRNIYIAGGHFFAQPQPQPGNWTYWEGSQYYLEREKIPGYTLWRYDINNDNWTKVKPLLKPGTQSLKRLASSGSISIPSINMSYTYGGYTSNRTSSNTPPAHMWATSGMIIYDHSTNTAQNITDPAGYGYTHARMHHLGPFGDHKGLLLILPGKKYNLSDYFEENISGGESYDFAELKFFDLTTSKFYTQRTSWLSNDRPAPRTRFCSVIVSEEEKSGWDLWIYGGQSSEDPDDQNKVLLSDMWVLTMPAFVWIKVPKVAGDDLRRSHTCHAAGRQMLILGGYPPGHYTDPNATCDTQLIQMFDLSNWSWNTEFKANSKYIRHSDVSAVQPHTYPFGVEWGHPVLKSLLDPPPTPAPTPTSTSIPTPTGKIVGGTIGGLVLVAAICFLIYYIWRRKRKPLVIPDPGNAGPKSGSSRRDPQDTVIPRLELEANGSPPGPVLPGNTTPEVLTVASSIEPVIETPTVQPVVSAADTLLEGERSGDMPPSPSRRRGSV